MWIRAILLLLLPLAGCVTAYDPQAASTSLPLTTARQVGTAPEPKRAPTPPPRRATRTIAAAPGETAPPPPTPRVSPPPSGAIAPPQTPAGKQLEWIVGVLGGEPLDRPRFVARRFAPSFLAKVPESQFRVIMRQWRRDHFGDGAARVVRLEGDEGGVLAAIVEGVATGAHTRIRVGVDAEGRIDTLWFAPAPEYNATGVDAWADADAMLTRLKGPTGALSLGAYEIAGDGLPRAVHRLGADRPLAIGSAFKLYVLGALAEEVAAGRIGWDLPLAIKDTLKSLPSGTMQHHQEGLEFPISRFAERMISISDNTATDHLLALLGRARVEDYVSRTSEHAGLNRPFLSTMDMFRLKLGPDRTLAQRYADADEPGRRALLDGEVATTIPSFAAAALWRAPFLVDRVEWFASADDLARVMADLHRLERADPELARVLRVNPGLAFDAADWTSVAFKGGSEPGVLSLTWLLTRRDGRVFVLSLTWNDTSKPVEQARLIEAAGAATRLLAREK
ncbi:MAG: serine hydrolase [Phycisphaerae bacterium]|nr:serine hydrolase [Phycisphaerae bacterium]